MSRSSSSTSSQSTTQEISQDQRALADNSGVALSSSTLNYSEQFPEPVAKAFQDLITLSRDAGQVVIDSNAKLVQFAEKSLDNYAKNFAIAKGDVSSVPQTISAITSTPATNAVTNSTKYIAFGAVALVAVYFLLIKGKK